MVAEDAITALGSVLSKELKNHEIIEAQLSKFNCQKQGGRKYSDE